MSGGSMGYRHEKVRAALEGYETLFRMEDSKGHRCTARRSFLEYLEELKAELVATADMLQAIELEDSGDAGPEATYAAWQEFQKRANTMAWPR